jgi:hypothetical protein
MDTSVKDVDEYCLGCVFYPPNLPESAYSAEDYALLQQKTCAYDFMPADGHCMLTRKTSCSVVDMASLNKPR